MDNNEKRRAAIMAAIRAVVRQGKIELDAPEDWAEGTEVLIEPIIRAASLGIRDEDWPRTPEGIAAHLAAMDRGEPLIFTEEERAAWEAARAEQEASEKARFEQRAEKFRGGWD